MNKNTIGISKQKRTVNQTVRYFMPIASRPYGILEPMGKHAGQQFKIYGEEFNLLCKDICQFIKYQAPYVNNKGYAVKAQWRLSEGHFGTTSVARHIYESFKSALEDNEKVRKEDGDQHNLSLSNLIVKGRDYDD